MANARSDPRPEPDHQPQEQILHRLRPHRDARNDRPLEHANVVRLHRAGDVDLLLAGRNDPVHLVFLLGRALERLVLDLDLRQLDRFLLLLLHQDLERPLVVEQLLVALLEGRQHAVDLLLVGGLDRVHLTLKRLHLRVARAVARGDVRVLPVQLDVRVAQLFDRRLLANLRQVCLVGDVVARALDHLPLGVHLEQPDVQVGELGVHAGQVLAEHALLVVQADRQQIAILLVAVELELRLLELPLELRLLLGQPGHRRACPFQLVVEVVLDVRVRDGVGDQGRSLGLSIFDRDERQARLLERLDRDLRRNRSPERREITGGSDDGGVVRVVLQPQLLRGALPHAGRLDDPVLGLVELLVRPEGPRPELDDVLRPGQDLRGHRFDDHLAGRLVDLGLPVGVDERDHRRHDHRQDHEGPALADRPPIGAEIDLGAGALAGQFVGCKIGRGTHGGTL